MTCSVVRPLPTESIHKVLNRPSAEALGNDTTPAELFLPVCSIERPQPRKIAIKAKGRILLINPTEVISVHGRGNYALLQERSAAHSVRATISEMIGKLERYGFIRVHKSLLVNTFFVEEIRPRPTGNYWLRVEGGKEYTVSRTYKKNLKLLADLWVGTDVFLPE